VQLKTLSVWPAKPVGHVHVVMAAVSSAVGSAVGWDVASCANTENANAIIQIRNSTLRIVPPKHPINCETSLTRLVIDQFTPLPKNYAAAAPAFRPCIAIEMPIR